LFLISKRIPLTKHKLMVKREYNLTVKSKSYKEADEIVNKFKEFLNEKQIKDVEFQLITRVTI